jgi:signal peptidase II
MSCRRLWALLAMLAILISDQWSKMLILQWFNEHSGKITLTPFLNFVLAWNRGISFSLFQANSIYGMWALIAIAVLISIILIWWIIKAETTFAAVCFAVILGGALGNVLDRLQYGAVIDFIDFHIFGYHWYTFNIADSGIVVGAALLLIQHLFFDPNHSTSKQYD